MTQNIQDIPYSNQKYCYRYHMRKAWNLTIEMQCKPHTRLAKLTTGISKTTNHKQTHSLPAVSNT